MINQWYLTNVSIESYNIMWSDHDLITLIKMHNNYPQKIN